MDRNHYDALRNSAGVIELARGKIAVTGEDRVRWLHGMVTNDVKSLAPGEGGYNFVLDSQGRIQADCNILMQSDRLIVDCEASIKDKLIALLDRFIVMDDVELADITDQLPTLAVIGPHAQSVVERIDTSKAIVYPTRFGIALWGVVNVPAAVVRVSEEAYETVRIEQQIPHYGVDIDATTIPNEVPQANALHFNKGCYIGQEIVERVRSRGHVNRTFTGFTSAGEIPAPFAFDQGRTTSATFSPALNCWIALGYVRREHAAQGTLVTIGGTKIGGTLSEVWPGPFAVPG